MTKEIPKEIINKLLNKKVVNVLVIDERNQHFDSYLMKKDTKIETKIILEELETNFLSLF